MSASYIPVVLSLPEWPVHRALPLMVAHGLVYSVSTAKSNPDVQPAVTKEKLSSLDPISLARVHRGFTT